MRLASSLGLIFAGHRYETEHALAALRIDNTLDDREKSRRICQLIEAANARAVEILRQRGRLTHFTIDCAATSEPIIDAPLVRIA
jgi:hypothetical protein